MKGQLNCSCILIASLVIVLVMLLISKWTVPKTVIVSQNQPKQYQPMVATSYKRRIMSGIPKEYTPVGYLQQLGDDNHVYPLYGRASRTNMSRWNYHTVTDRLSNIPLPIQSMDGRDCTLDMGCNELYDGDQVQIKGLTGVFTVTMYHMDFRREGGF